MMGGARFPCILVQILGNRPHFLEIFIIGTSNGIPNFTGTPQLPFVAPGHHGKAAVGELRVEAALSPELSSELECAYIGVI